MVNLTTPPWWRSDTYNLEGADNGLDLGDTSLWGPHGPGVVGMYSRGGETVTDKGWGRDEFMSRYRRKMFHVKPFLMKQLPFAWVMRSARAVCIDIDGKNGGFDHVVELGFLPPTVAEISQSGNGYHLFYSVEDEWDPLLGFAKFSDAIGIVEGVDFRGTGCVFHKTTQRWNSRPLAPFPAHLEKQLLTRQQRRTRSSQEIKKMLQLDPEEIAIMHDQLLDELKKPIPAGRRNQSLFAIGQKLKEAEVPNWESLILDRASQVGLDDDESEKLVANISRYGS